MNEFLSGLTTYYGMDWLAMCIGLYANFLITRQKRHGFLLASIACCLGLTVAAMSHQIGYVAYNGLLIAMMGRAFFSMPKTATI